jgi:hypothetical protein
MDSITPEFQSTPVVSRRPESVSTWYDTEYHQFSDMPGDQLAWLYAQGWENYQVRYDEHGNATGTLTRRVLKPESVLDDLVESYTEAYNEGRELNDQRYDDLVVLYSTVLSNSEDVLSDLADDEDDFEDAVESIITLMGSDYTSYANDVDGHLDDYGDSMRLQINARFDAELSKAQQALVDRGTYNTTTWPTTSAGIERERTLALTDLEDKIAQQELRIKDRVYQAKADMRARVLAARDRVRSELRGATDRRLATRNAIVDALARFVERRTDSYPDLDSIGRLAASLGAGSPEAQMP